MCIYKGENIKSAAARLVPLEINELRNAIASPDKELEGALSQVRIIRKLDERQYSAAKRELPFVVCASFDPPYRRQENFAYTEYFILDIDHIAEKGLDVEDVKKKVTADTRVIMAFVSPGEDGLKLLFHLSERCYDAGEYALFYKAFVSSFSMQYELSQVIDSRTCDVTRACFLSMDSDVFYRPEADAVVMKDYVDIDNPFSAFSLKHDLESVADESEDCQAAANNEKEISDEAMDRIRYILASKREQQRMDNREIYVPRELEAVMDPLVEMLLSNGISTIGVRNIQYGKKLHLCLDETKFAEINLFYGKRGFTAVSTTKRGTDPEFSDLAADLIDCSINEIYGRCLGK